MDFVQTVHFVPILLKVPNVRDNSWAGLNVSIPEVIQVSWTRKTENFLCILFLTSSVVIIVSTGSLSLLISTFLSFLLWLVRRYQSFYLCGTQDSQRLQLSFFPPADNCENCEYRMSMMYRYWRQSSDFPWLFHSLIDEKIVGVSISNDMSLASGDLLPSSIKTRTERGKFISGERERDEGSTASNFM